MADMPDWAKEILDLRAGKDHSAQGPVMACLEEILTRHGAETRTRVLATMDQALMTLIDRENDRDGEHVLDVTTLEHARKVVRMQVGLLSWQDALDHNGQVAAAALAEPARPDGQEELLARIDALSEQRIRAKVADELRAVAQRYRDASTAQATLGAQHQAASEAMRLSDLADWVETRGGAL